MHHTRFATRDSGRRDRPYVWLTSYDRAGNWHTHAARDARHHLRAGLTAHRRNTVCVSTPPVILRTNRSAVRFSSAAGVRGHRQRRSADSHVASGSLHALQRTVPAESWRLDGALMEMNLALPRSL